MPWLLSAALAFSFLAASAAGPIGAGAPGPVGAEQKWSWSDLQALKKQVHERLHDKKESLAEGIASYADAVKLYADYLKDSAFQESVAATGICEHLKTSIDASSSSIAGKMPALLCDAEADPAEDSMVCQAAADETCASEIKRNLMEGDTGEVVDTLMKVVTQRVSGAICEQEQGVKDWLKENAGLRTTDPARYKEELKEELQGKVQPILEDYALRFCPSDSEQERLFELGSGPLAAARSSGIRAVAFTLAFAASSMLLGALAARRASTGMRELSEEPNLLERGVEVEGILLQ